MQQVKAKLQEAMALLEKAEQEKQMAPDIDLAMIAAKASAKKTPGVREMASLLAEALGVLEYGTYHGGKYGQMHTQRFQQRGSELAARIANALGTKPYEAIKEAINGN